MQRITPFLWFEKDAQEAVNFYTSIFKKSKIISQSFYDKAGAQVSGMTEGSLMTVSFRLAGQDFGAINAGPYYKFNPSVSFFINCDSLEEFEHFWDKLSVGASILMPRNKYPFSQQYGWLTDRFGVSWQINLGKRSQKICPSLLFVGSVCGRAKEAIDFYTSIFEKSKVNNISRYEKGEPDIEGNIKYSSFFLAGSEFSAMESSGPHKFDFQQSISFIINCKTQKEVDYYWSKLSEGGREVQCGWITDKFGLPWQVVPIVLPKLLSSKDRKKSSRVMEAMLKMIKLDIKKLKDASK